MRQFSELRSWALQLGSMLRQYSDVSDKTDDLIAAKILSESVPNNPKQITSIRGELERMQRVQGAVLEALLKFSKRLNYDSTLEMLTDLTVFIERTNESLKNWRRAKAVFDLNLALNNFAEDEEQGVTKEQAEAAVESAKKEYETSLSLFDALVPQTSSILQVVS